MYTSIRMGILQTLSKQFKNKDLYLLALTHKSWVNEHKGARESNERLEFLGDAILEFVVSKELYNKYPSQPEGYLTALRANLVNTENLAKIAKKLKLGGEIYLSKGEEDGGGRNNPSILADTIEAIIGALYLDGGTEASETFIKEILLKKIDKITSKPLKDSKSRFQEIIQSKGFPSPKYVVVEENGPDHNKQFTIEVKVDNKIWGRGVGKNKGEAAQDAAKNALLKFN